MNRTLYFIFEDFGKDLYIYCRLIRVVEMDAI